MALRRSCHVWSQQETAATCCSLQVSPAWCLTVALAESLQKDLRDEGIGVSVLCPMRVTSNIDFSNRNRPQALGGPSANRTYTDEERASLNGATLAVEPVADLVVAAIKRNSLPHCAV